jgi:CheY-like chemotaxis protein
VRLGHATDPATDRLLGADTTPVRRANLSGVTVLVVEDDPDARELCAQALAAHDAVVTTAASVGEALEAIDAVRPAVIIADLGIPGEDGFALIGRLRADERARGHRTFVIALTAYAGPQDRRRVLDAGFDAHVAKPYDPAELATMIERVTRDARPR